MSWPETKYVLNNIHEGIEPGNMKMLNAQPADGGAKIRFTEPGDTIIDNQVVCTWKGVKIVIKEGSGPILNENDGRLLLDCTEAGKHTEDPLVVSGLQNGTEYTVAAFPYSDHGVVNYNLKNQIKITPQNYILLGFKIKKGDSNPQTRVEYTEMAAGHDPAKVDLSTGVMNYGSFSDYWFVTENKPYMVYSNGEAAYELDPNDYTKKKGGGASDVSNDQFDGNAMAKIPLVWIKQWEDAQYEYCNICNIQYDDTYKADAFKRADGSIMDYIWLSMFSGSLVSGKIRSLKGKGTMNTQTGTNEITYAKANGDLWYTRTWSQRNVINMLLILMGKSENTQEVFGYGHYNGGSSAANLLQTGTLSDKGQFCGYNTTGKSVKVFHMEDWWGNAWERIAGLMYINNKIYTKMVPPYNTTGDGYTDTGVTMGGTSGGYCSVTKMTENGRLPVTMSGSETTYTCDGGWFTAGPTYAIVGGSCNSGLPCGASCVSLGNAVSRSAWPFGAALSCEEPLAA